MDLSSVQAQKTLNYEGIKEVKTPLSNAIGKIKEDGLKEVFFKAGDKEFVAYGKNLDVDKFKNSTSDTFNGAKVNIYFVDDEINSAGEGAKSALESVAGKITTGAAGALVGPRAGYVVTGIGFTAGAIIVAAPFTFFGALLVGGAAVGAAIAGAGAIYGATKNTDYQAINTISQ